MKKNVFFTVFISLIVALGGFLLGFDSAVISGAAPFYRSIFRLEVGSGMLGFSVSSIIAGAILGNFIGGPLSDKLGRKLVLLFTAILFSFCALGTSLTSNLFFFILARIIGGVGVGMAILVAPVYIAEISPKKYRGTLVSINQLNIVLGISAAYFSNYFILNKVSSPDLNWRWMLGVGAIPAILYFLLLLLIPQSPRWLIMKKRDEEALKVLIKVGGEEYAESLHKEIHATLDKSNKKERVSISKVFTNRYYLILIIGFGIAFFQQITGINAIFYYAPMIFGMAGGGRDSAFMQAAILGLTNVAFTVIAMFLIDKLGRKPLLIIGAIGITISLSIAGFAFKKASFILSDESISKIIETVKESEDSRKDLDAVQKGLPFLVGKHYKNEVKFFNDVEKQIGSVNYNLFRDTILENSISMKAVLVLIGLIMYVASFAISLGPVMWTLLSEIFPNKLRGIMISLVGTWNSVVSFSVATLFPVELEVYGTSTTFLVFALFGLLTLLFVLKYVPETKGKSLEEIEETLIK
ncbi:MAG: sugar porter family MFS transporter [Bacteroidales bacterium]|nr:sugar porter family MFS transporter [Bacteroidales bacterium]